MSEPLEKIVSDVTENMRKAINHLEIEISKIRAGKAHPNIVDGIMVDYYGTPTPIAQVANVTVPDARTLALQPWEKKMMPVIEKAILQANIGLTPQNDGTYIRLHLPPLTEDRRKDLVKKVYTEGEQGKIAVRNIRKEAMEAIKKLQKEGLSEDIAKSYEAKVQAITDKNILLADQHCKEREKEIMTV